MSRKLKRPVYNARRYFTLGLFTLAMLGLIARAVELQVLRYDFHAEQGEARHYRNAVITAHRGMITDRNDKPLAISTPVDAVWINPQRIKIDEQQKNALRSLLKLSSKSLQTRIEDKKKEFVYLARSLPPDVVENVMQLGISGLSSSREYRRYYPQGEVFAHVLGFTNIDDIGQEGLELSYDKWLAGRSGKKRVLRDGKGQVVEEVGLIQAARKGRTLQLTIDERLQNIAYRELKAAVHANHAKSGSVVVLDVLNGDVLAMVSQPSFNPNDRSQRRGGPIRNRAVKDQFEPGSTMKPFTIAAALESGQYSTRSVVDTSPGYITVSGHTIKDPHNYGPIDLATIISKSSNVGAGMVSLKLKPAYLWGVFDQLGFGASVESGFPGEARGLLREYSTWYDVDQATVAFGYSISVTALQLAQAYAVLAADGVHHPVNFVVRDQPAQAAKQVLSAATARAVRKMMEGVVSPGSTGYLAAVDGYRVAGKTGTSRKSIGGVYSDDRHTATFAGIAPAVNPRIVAVVVIDEPREDRVYGGEVAAPVFSRVVQAGLRLLNVPPENIREKPRLVAHGGSQ